MLDAAILNYRVISSEAMSTTTTITTAAIEAPRGRVFSHGTNVKYGDFRDDLLKNGFAVVKGAVPRDRALGYADAIHEWLEGLYVPSPPAHI
jgi:hypothetical protein